MKKIVQIDVEELGKRNARARRKVEQLRRMQIETEFALTGKIIPASSADFERNRTAYFYRREAIEWARMARHPDPQTLPSWPAACARTAKAYLHIYRTMKGAALT